MFFKILLLLIFQSSEPRFVLQSLFLMAGLWMIFKKCGIESWKALIPCYRYVALGECAGRKSEGNALFILNAITTVYQVLEFCIYPDGAPALFLIVFFLIGFVHIIYQIRVYMGLVKLFGAKNIWCVAWVLAEGVCALIWGLLKHFQPQWQVKDLENRVTEYFQGGNIDALEEGLTVNLTERTVREAFRKKYLLRDIHMYIKPGSMVLLLGGSGAGKTTFVNAVNGYEKAKAEIILNGGNVYKEYKKMKYEVGFVPQQDLMRGNDTVLRTLTDAAALRLPIEFSAAERRERVEYVMEIFGLLPVQDSLVEKLSGGQRKRLSIAMEFVSNPSLFILDEPDSGLDGVMARELMEQLRKIADQGKIVIVITHTPDRVIDLFDDVIVLAKDENRTGRLAYYGPVPEARKYFGEEKMEEIVKCVNRTEEGGKGLADTFIRKYAEVRNG